MNHNLDINLIPGGVVPAVHMSQGDAIPSGEEVKKNDNRTT